MSTTAGQDHLEYLINKDPKRSVVALAALAGIANALSRASSKNMGDRMDTLSIIFFSITLGPIYGIFGLYLISAIARSAGHLLGGNASASHMRAVLAWASLPIACELALWVPKLILGGSEMFTKRTPTLDAKPDLNTYFWAILLVEILLIFWTFVIAQGHSARPKIPTLEGTHKYIANFHIRNNLLSSILGDYSWICIESGLIMTAEQ